MVVKMHSKIINKIKSNDLKVNLENIIQSCEIIHKDRYLLPFSDHGINHSERMIISLELICKNIYSGTNSLNEYESFIYNFFHFEKIYRWLTCQQIYLLSH